MIMRNHIAVDGVSLAKYGAWVDGHKILNEPEPDVEVISVPGRNGDLTIDNGRYRNVTVVYQCGILKDFLQNLTAIKGLLMSNRGYRRIEDTFERAYYRMGRYVGGMEPTASQMYKQGYFELAFDCKPQRWLKTGEQSITYTTGSTIYNPTSFPAKPLLVVTGYGQVIIGTYRIVIAQHTNNRVWIDCDLQDAWFGSSNLNSVITLPDGVFPEIVPGSVPVTFSSTISAVQITPRWWTI